MFGMVNPSDAEVSTHVQAII